MPATPPRIDALASGAEIAGSYARICLASLGHEVDGGRLGLRKALGVAEAWRDSGLDRLTGPRSHALACPLPLPLYADGVMLALNSLLPAERQLPWLGRRILGMRRLSHRLCRGGQVSAGGSCHLLPGRGGWLAVNLAREDDWALLPAWLEQGELSDWSAVAAAVAAGADVAKLQARARLLGLAVALVGPPPAQRPWFSIEASGPRARSAKPRPLVLDLSSLWAGPLCTQLLQMGGAEVIKIEHPRRPDGARFGPPLFFRCLNQGKHEQALDLARSADHERFLELLGRADIVVEGLRPRVLQQFGVRAEDWLQQRAGRTWLSITGYGRGSPQGEWVAFGDDAAVAGGLAHLMQTLYGEPLFVGDAIADPLTGLHAALALGATHLAGGGRLISVPMRDVVAHCARVGGL